MVPEPDSQFIEVQHLTPDDFSLYLTEELRKLIPGASEKAFLYAAQGFKIFMELLCHPRFWSDDFFAFYLDTLGYQLTTERVEEVTAVFFREGRPRSNNATPKSYKLEIHDPHTQEMAATVFVYFALISGALAKIVHTFLPPELHEAAIDLATGRLLDEFAPERIEELRKKAAVRGMLGQLILQ